MADVLGCGGLIVGDHGQARSHGFEHHIAKGFGQAREQEQVAAGVMFGQRFAALGAAEHRIGHLLLEGRPLRAITHHHQAQAPLWVSVLQGLQAGLQQCQVLFRCQAPDVQHSDVVRVEPPVVP